MVVYYIWSMFCRDYYLGKIKYMYKVLSPDGFSIECIFAYNGKKRAEIALDKFVKRYEAQGYYSTIQNGERVRIPLSELKDYCLIAKI